MLDQQHVVGAAIGEQAEQFGTFQLRPALVLGVPGDDVQAALMCEGVERRAGAASVLLVGRGSEIGADEYESQNFVLDGSL